MSWSFIRLTRAQSVFETLEEDGLFVRRSFAEGDDADFIFTLSVNDRHSDAAQETEGYESLFLVLEAVVLLGERWTLKHLLRIDEV
jgi:hypothetical protein